MLTRLHANATTTPKVRAEIQASSDSVAVLAKRHHVSETTIRRWRGRTSVEDRSHVRYNLGQGPRRSRKRSSPNCGSWPTSASTTSPR